MFTLRSLQAECQWSNPVQAHHADLSLSAYDSWRLMQ